MHFFFLSLKLIAAFLGLDPALIPSPPTTHLAVNCVIMNYDTGEVVKHFPYKNCLFLDDGSLLAQDTEHRYLILFDRDFRPLWKKAMTPHHVMSTNEDQSEFYVLDTEYVAGTDGNKIAYTAIYAINRAGQTIKEWRYRDHVEELAKLGVAPMLAKTAFNQTTEGDHINSIYQIPANASNHAALSKGNFVACAEGLGHLLFFDSSLSKVVHVTRLMAEDNHLQPPHTPIAGKARYGTCHDAQVLPSGNLLYFRNRAPGADETQAVTLLEEMDVSTGKTLWSYSAPDFEAHERGAVHKMSTGNVLFSDPQAATIKEISPKGELRKIFSDPVKYFPPDKTHHVAINLRVGSYRKFFSNYRGP